VSSRAPRNARKASISRTLGVILVIAAGLFLTGGGVLSFIAFGLFIAVVIVGLVTSEKILPGLGAESARMQP